MKSGQSVLNIIVGFGFLIVFTLQYLRDPLSYYVPLIFFFLIFIIMGIFEFREYNKIVYILSTVLLVVMWIVSFIQSLSSDVNEIVYYIETGLITLAIIILFIDSLKRLRKKEKALECYDKALAINPNDVIALNNKGVELASQRRYMESIECFDKVLEINPEDATALHNKSFIDRYGKHRMVSDYLEKGPELEINEEDGKLILMTKK